MQKTTQIRFYHFWKEQDENMWFFRYLKENQFINNDLDIAFIGPLGYRSCVNTIRGGHKVFFTGENIHRQDRMEYRDYLLSEISIDLAMGFDYYFPDNRYFRFPLWMLYVIRPEDSEFQIRKSIEMLRHPPLNIDLNNRKFCSMIARYDSDNGFRSYITQKMNQVERVSCAGLLMHNDDSLVNLYGDNKIEYLKHYIFNICFENSDSKGYVTEKLFQAIQAGCVPVYWGSNNCPEPEVINPNATIFMSPNQPNTDSMNLIRDLQSNKRLLQDFVSQPRLLPTAEEFIFDNLSDLFNRFSKFLK